MRKKKDTPTIPTFSKKFSNYQKSNKSKSQHSILQKHQIYMDRISNNEELLINLNKKITVLRGNSKQPNENNIKILELEKERDFLESQPTEIDYLLESSQIIHEYMTLEEKEMELLNIKDLDEKGSIDLNVINNKKNELVDMFLTKFETGYNSIRNCIKEIPVCTDCNIPYNIENSFFVCSVCGRCEKTVEQANELSYKERQEYDYRPQFTYDKKTHLEDWLRRFQAKENRGIPQEILDKVILEAKKERVQDLNALTEEKVKKYLKKLNLNDYYDNVIGIINRINGRPPFTLTLEVENKIKTMFQQIQDPYENFKPASRKNFLSYSYTLCKFFQILGLHEFAKYFPLLKSTDKLRQQDDIFKKIVGYMSQNDPTTKWVFYPSI